MTPALPNWFRMAMSQYKRVAIAGGPRTGKTVWLAAGVTDRPVINTDAVMNEAWENVPFVCIQRVKDLDSFVIEGVQVPRCLRKGMEVDAVIWLSKPKAPRNAGQTAMGLAVATVFEDWRRSFNLHQIPIIREPAV